MDNEVTLIVTNVFNENTKVTALDIIKRLLLTHIKDISKG